MFTKKYCYVCGDPIGNEDYYDFTESGNYPDDDEENEYAHTFCHDHGEPRESCDACTDCGRQFNCQVLKDGLCPECAETKERAKKEVFPNKLYSTPETWGNVGFILDEEQAEEAANSMTECSGEDCDISECKVLWFVKLVDSDTALYEDADNKHLVRREGNNFAECID